MVGLLGNGKLGRGDLVTRLNFLIPRAYPPTHTPGSPSLANKSGLFTTVQSGTHAGSWNRQVVKREVRLHPFDTLHVSISVYVLYVAA